MVVIYKSRDFSPRQMPRFFDPYLRLRSYQIETTTLPTKPYLWVSHDQCSSSPYSSTCRNNHDLSLWNIPSVDTLAMPHSTREPSLNRASSKYPSDTRNFRTSMEKFPDHVDSLDGQPIFQSSPIAQSNGFFGGLATEPRWQARRDSALKGSGWANGHTGGHGRQKSLSDAFRTIRTRRASVSANVHEISDALKAPVSPKLIVRQPSL
jgi:hypothetical protein